MIGCFFLLAQADGLLAIVSAFPTLVSHTFPPLHVLLPQ